MSHVLKGYLLTGIDEIKYYAVYPTAWSLNSSDLDFLTRKTNFEYPEKEVKDIESLKVEINKKIVDLNAESIIQKNDTIVTEFFANYLNDQYSFTDENVKNLMSLLFKFLVPQNQLQFVYDILQNHFQDEVILTAIRFTSS